MRRDLMYISGVMAFATLATAVLLLSLLPAVTAQESNSINNSTIMNSTTPENLMLNNQTAVSSQEDASPNSAFHIGEGNDESIFDLGNPVKPVRDLEKIVFVCDIV